MGCTPVQAPPAPPQQRSCARPSATVAAAWCPRRSTEAAASFAAPTHQRHQRQRRQARRCVAAAAAKQPRQGGTREKIPVFPLGIVALPAADVPLQIFEVGAWAARMVPRPSAAGSLWFTGPSPSHTPKPPQARYRVLFSTLMAGAQGCARVIAVVGGAPALRCPTRPCRLAPAAPPLAPLLPEPPLPALRSFEMTCCSVDEGLVNTEKPWCGSRLFGMAFYDNKSQVRGVWRTWRGAPGAAPACPAAVPSGVHGQPFQCRGCCWSLRCRAWRRPARFQRP